MLVAAAVQGSIGFGANIVAMPLLFLIDPAFVPGPALLGGFGLNVLNLVRDRRSAAVRPIGTALVGRIGGTMIAVATLRVLSEEGIGLVVALVVLSVVALSLSGMTAPRTTRNMLTGGVFSGFGAGTAGIGGPPVALLFQDSEGPEVRGSLGLYFVVGNVISLTGLAIAGRFGTDEIRLGLALAPAAVAGFAISRWFIPFVDRGRMRTAILVVSSAAAAGLLLDLVS